MKKSEFDKMINAALEEFNGMNANYKAMILMLKPSYLKGNYIPVRIVNRAKERIEVLKQLKDLDLLK